MSSCATYLFSNPVSKHGSAGAADTGFFDGLVGVALLCGYLFFDGMVSTTQERVFGKNENPGDPFGREWLAPNRRVQRH